MKRWRRWIACLAVSSIMSTPLWAAATDAAPAGNKDVPFLGGFLKETRVVYPLRIGDWSAQGEHLYDMQELGASVRYVDAQKGRWIDLYFYPAGVLPAARLAQDMDATLEGIRLSAGQAGSYSEVEIGGSVPVSFALDAGKDRKDVAARSVSMRLVREGTEYSSAMVMLVKDLFYMKGRFSAEARALSRRDTQQQLEQFMAEVVRRSSLSSTGECWMPPPIIAKSALVDDDPDQLATMDAGGVLSAVAYADRVEALQPRSPEARMMQLTAMSLGGRLFEGCVPAEDMNPAVPDGMREIRLEFNAPSDAGGNPSIQLRPASSGVS